MYSTIALGQPVSANVKQQGTPGGIRRAMTAIVQG